MLGTALVRQTHEERHLVAVGMHLDVGAGWLVAVADVLEADERVRNTVVEELDVDLLGGDESAGAVLAAVVADEKAEVGLAVDGDGNTPDTFVSGYGRDAYPVARLDGVEARGVLS